MDRKVFNELKQYQENIETLEKIKSNLRNRGDCILKFPSDNFVNAKDISIFVDKVIYSSVNEDSDEVESFSTNEIEANLYEDIKSAVKNIVDEYINKYENKTNEIMKKYGDENADEK